jgi:hypothetical protein
METDKESAFTIPKSAWVTSLVLVAGVTASVVWLWRAPYEHPPAERFLGPGACKGCHEKVFTAWADTRMASSFDVLRPGRAVEEKKIANLDPEADYTHDENCVPCHTTGFGLAGGFRSLEETPEMAGVTCEACHGPGGSYAGVLMSKTSPNFATADVRAAGLVYPPTATVCRKCHNEDSPFVQADYVFDFTERVARGTHEHLPLEYRHDGG